MHGSPYHYAMDKYGVLDNGKVSKAYLEHLKLDPKCDDKARERMFLEVAP